MSPCLFLTLPACILTSLAFPFFSFFPGIACWLERRTRDRKVASSNPGRSGGENFLLQSQLYVLTLIRCPFHPRVTAVAHKRPRSFCQKCGWQVTPKHARTLDPSKSEWADYAAVQAECGNLSGNKLTHNSFRNAWSQLSQLAEPLWTDPGLKSGFSLHELISTLKKTKSTSMG